MSVEHTLHKICIFQHPKLLFYFQVKIGRELRYVTCEPSSKLWWCRARYLFWLRIPVTTEGFELRISCIRSSYLTNKTIRPNDLMAWLVRQLLRMQEVHSSNSPVVTGICDSNKSRSRHHCRKRVIYHQPLIVTTWKQILPEYLFTKN